MTQPKLPANWSRTAQTVQYEGTDLARDRADAIRGFAALQDVVAVGREILIHVATDSEYVKASGSTFREIRVEFWADSALVKAMRCDQLREAIKVARFYASVLPNAFLVHRLDETVPRALATTNARDLLFNVVPALSWYVEGLMPAGQVTLLSGDGGTGKSLIALQLAAATAAGRLWLGLEPTTGAVMVVSAEDDEDELHRRLVGICNEIGIGATELEGLHLRSLVGQDPLLGVLDPETRGIEPTQLFLELQRSVRETRPALLVLDTLADFFGGDQNVRSQARQFVGLLRNLTLAVETTVLRLAHPSLAGISTGTGASGSTGWSNSVRSRLYLERVMEWRGKGDNRRFVEPNPNARLLTTKKANYGPSGGTISLRWHNGILERHETPAANDASLLATQETAEEASARVDAKFLELLTAFTAEGRNVGPLPSSTYAPMLFAKDPRSELVTKSAFIKSMGALIAKRRILIEETRRGTKRLVISTEEPTDPPADLGAD